MFAWERLQARGDPKRCCALVLFRYYFERLEGLEVFVVSCRDCGVVPLVRVVLCFDFALIWLSLHFPLFFRGGCLVCVHRAFQRVPLRSKVLVFFSFLFRCGRMVSPLFL